MGNPRITDVTTLIAAGFDPKTGLPFKASPDVLSSPLSDNMRKILRITDEQNAINRYKWYNLPSTLDSQLVERILYYKGQGMFFYMEETDQFFFLPFALDGTIDCYGRFTGVTPLPFNGSTKADGKEKPWIQGLTRTPIYEVQQLVTEKDWKEKCVLLTDYSKQISQTIIPRQILNEGIISVECEMIPYMRTALSNSTGVQGMRVTSEDEQQNVELASRAVEQATLDGRKWIPVVGNLDFQTLDGGNAPARAEEFLLAMQALDNFRLGSLGLVNGGLFQKKAHELQTEQQMNTSHVSSVLQDGLTIRQNFCDMLNSLFPLGVWCEASEQAIDGDRNLDGFIGDEVDQSGTMPNEQPAMVGGDVE